MASSKVVPLTCHGHSRPVPHLSFSAMVDDQCYLVSACKDNNPMLRDGLTGDWIGTFIGHKGAVWQSRLSPTALYAVTGSGDFAAKLWDTNTGECLLTMQHNHIVRAVSFNPGPTPTIIATGGFEKKLRLYDISGATSVAQGSPLANDPPFIEIGAGIHQGTIKSVVWTPDPNVLVTAADDKKLRWFDIRTQDPIASHALDALPSSCELSINPSPGDGGGDTAVLSVAAGKSAYFFSGNRPGELIKSLTLPLELGSVAINTNESKFVTGSSTDTWVRLHDFEDGKELNVHKGHHGPVWSTSFSPDGKLYATGSEDGTVKLWKFTNGPYGLWK